MDQINDSDTTDNEDEFKTFEENFEMVTVGMVLNGVYPKKSLRTYATAVIMPFIIFVCLAIHSCWISLKNGDFREFTKQMPVLLSSEISLVKLIIFHFKQDKIRKLISDISNTYRQAKYKPEWEKKCIKEEIAKAQKRPLLWLFLGICGILSMWATPLIQSSKADLENNYRKKIEIHDLTLPFLNEHKYKFPLFKLMYMYTLLTFIFIAIIYLAVDGFFIIVATHTEMQLKILNIKVLNLFSDLKGSATFLLKFRIKNIVCHYLEIERFHSEVQDLMSGIFSNIFFLNSLHLCVSAFQTVDMIEKREIELGDLMIVIGTLIQAYFPCNHGSIISDLSENIGEAAYFSNWYENMDPATLLSINIIMIRVQRPLEYTAFRIIPINIESFSSILTSAWSLFNILRSQL